MLKQQYTLKKVENVKKKKHNRSSLKFRLRSVKYYSSPFKINSKD